MTLSDDEAFAIYNEATRQGYDDAVQRLIVRLDAEDEAKHARLTAPEALAQAAAWYASQNIPVFPLQPRDKRPMPGSRGFKDATTDLEIIHEWWTTTPTANIGMPTGHMFDVIDVDGPDGYRSLADLRDAGALPPILGKVITPRGGQHLYTPPTGDGNTTAVWPGIDYRGAGGYVVIPPSVGPNGRLYAWIQPLNPATARQAA